MGWVNKLLNFRQGKGAICRGNIFWKSPSILRITVSYSGEIVIVISKNNINLGKWIKLIAVSLLVRTQWACNTYR